jgi:hypothetical protein
MLLGCHKVGPNLASLIIILGVWKLKCVEIEVENCKRVLERHEFISLSDTDEEAKAKLVKMLGCPADNMCNCDQSTMKHMAEQFSQSILLRKIMVGLP